MRAERPRWYVGAVMRTPHPVLFAALLAACGGGAELDSEPAAPTQGGACGEVSEHDILIRARVVDSDGITPVAGAELRIVEDRWHQPERVWGSGITGADGVGEFTAAGIVSVEDCWGVALNYILTAQLGDRVASDTMYNSSLFNAINSQTWEADTTAFPLVLPP